jgi:hypothetical protein
MVFRPLQACAKRRSLQLIYSTTALAIEQSLLGKVLGIKQITDVQLFYYVT